MTDENSVALVPWFAGDLVTVRTREGETYTGVLEDSLDYIGDLTFVTLETDTRKFLIPVTSIAAIEVVLE